MTATSVSKPELLSPAGDMEAMRAAVANGADAVYFGLSDFNARHRATNFTLDELSATMQFLHEHGVRGYVTLNTLIFSDELPQLVDYLSAVARAGVDAVIVQDLGLVRLLKRMVPGLAVHGSTQMTLTERRGIDFVRALGVERVILARELSIPEIGRIARETPMPLEVFVHGALCVAYSGQCLTSEAIGGRSANRGQCAQACRQPYELIVDGQARDLGDQAYLLSPQDLAAYDCIADLAEAGVCSVKIEGRLKSPHYVAVTTQTYRASIDAAAAGEKFTISRQQELDLAQSFSRGFTHGFLDGVNHQVLVQGRFPKNRGVRIGQVVELTRQSAIIELDERLANHADETDVETLPVPLKPGDGVVFDEGHPEQDEQGGRVFSVTPYKTARHTEQPRIEITFGHGDVNLAAVSVGSTLWKTDDPALRKRLENTFRRELPAQPTPISVRMQGEAGGRLQVFVRQTPADQTPGEEVTVTWEQPLAAAQKHPLTAALIREQFGRLGKTPFVLGKVELQGSAGPVDSLPVMVPKSVLNDLRRQAVQALIERPQVKTSEPIIQTGALDALRAEVIAKRPLVSQPLLWPVSRPSHTDRPTGLPSGTPALYVLVRNLAQLQGVLDWQSAIPGYRPAMVYCDFEEVILSKDAVVRCKAAGLPVALATPRIIKPTEEGLLLQIANCRPDAVLLRSLAGVSFFQEKFPQLQLLGDYALNVTNEISAAIFADAGLSRLVPGYDLNLQQLAAMLKQIDPGLFEVVLHQHMPMFHMEHCVFSHTLSNGKDFHDCGRPCDLHRVELRDHVGEAHPLVADVGCRNTVYNARPQSAAPYVPQLRACGVQHFRVELLRESAAETQTLLDTYANVLTGKEQGSRLSNDLRVLNQLGVTRGTLDFA